MHLPLQAYRRMKMVSAWKESKELDVRAIAFQLISIFNWAQLVLFGYAPPALLEFGHMFLDGILDLGGAGHALEFDFRWRLHFLLSLVCATANV